MDKQTQDKNPSSHAIRCKALKEMGFEPDKNYEGDFFVFFRSKDGPNAELKKLLLNFRHTDPKDVKLFEHNGKKVRKESAQFSWVWISENQSDPDVKEKLSDLASELGESRLREPNCATHLVKKLKDSSLGRIVDAHGVPQSNAMDNIWFRPKKDEDSERILNLSQIGKNRADAENAGGGEPALVSQSGQQDQAEQQDQTPRKPKAEPNPQVKLLQTWCEDLQVTLFSNTSRPCFNLILEGVPGTGKTYSLAQLRGKVEKGESETVKRWMADWAQGRFAMTMHPATAYEDFVEGLRPGKPPKPVWSPEDEGCQDFATNPSGDNIRWFCSGTTTTETAGQADPSTKTEAQADAPTGTQGPTDASERGPTFSIHNGFFVRVCEEAVHFPNRIFVVLLDEINRCNIPKVMGDLLTTLEPSKRAKWGKGPDGEDCWDLTSAQIVTLPYSQRSFFVPDNVVVVGTMNTTDRSVAPMDAALRRRFAFARVYPQGFGPGGGDTNQKEYENNLLEGMPDGDAKVALRNSWKLWVALNTRLQQKFGDDAMLGHSYLWDLRDALKDSESVKEITESRWDRFILPQLVDILVSNDLVDNVVKVDDKDSTRQASWVAPFDPFKNYITVQLRGSGLLRVPVLSLKVLSLKDDVDLTKDVLSNLLPKEDSPNPPPPQAESP